MSPESLPHNAAFSRLFREHVRFVCGVLHRLGVRSADIDDVAQEVFVVLHAKLRSLDPEKSPRPFLFAICMRVAKAQRVANAQQMFGQSSSLAIDVADGAVAPDEQLASREAHHIVQQALDTLDSQRREVVVMHDFYDFHAPEIADTLGIRLNTVYSRLRVGRQEFERAIRRVQARRRVPQLAFAQVGLATP